MTPLDDHQYIRRANAGQMRMEISPVVEQGIQLPLFAHELLCRRLYRLQARQIEAQEDRFFPCVVFEFYNGSFCGFGVPCCEVDFGVVGEKSTNNLFPNSAVTTLEMRMICRDSES